MQLQAWGVSESETEPELAFLQAQHPGPGQAPFFRTQLRGLRLTEGTDAVLQCSIGGNPKPQIGWFKDGRPLEAFGLPQLQFSYKGSSVMLRINEVQRRDAGQYLLLLSNHLGKVGRRAF